MIRLVVVALLFVGCGVVDPGERAVFSYWGRVEEKCYPEGLYFYNPLTTDMWEIDAKVQAVQVTKAEAATRDLQTIHTDIVVNFGIDGERCHELVRSVGMKFHGIILAPAIQETLKAATSHFQVEKVIQDRPKLKAEIEAALRDRMKPYAINIQAVNLVNFGFDPLFDKAIVEKQVQEQRVQTAEYQRMEAVKLAERAVAIARGQADSNKLLQESLKQSPEALRFKELELMREKWDGRLPQAILGGSAAPLISVGSVK